MIEIKNIVKSYGELKVLKGIDLTIKEKEIVTIVGASGAGKSTLLHILGTLDTPDEGELLYDSVNIARLSSNKLSEFRNNNIGFVFQFHHLLPEFTALENVCIPAWIKGTGKKEAEQRATELLTLLGLEERVNHKPNQLSGGEQQRIVLARAILKNAPIIVLDEATAFADPENEHLIQQALKELTKGKTVLMIAHRLSSITDADNILVIDKGKIAEQGTHAKLLEKQGIYYNMWNEYQQSVRWTIGKEVSND